MPLIQVLIILIAAGVVLWLINSYVPMASSIKKIINVLVIVVVILWLLNLFGVFGSFSSIRVGRQHTMGAPAPAVGLLT